ncbi:MAG TPA: hypothetical protein VFX05_16470 [Casimicrobiaceae bacterium]|jgi:hypothetical protein|nr:hypothetical protein [Casimicrobiaceae bacterium]
MNPQHAHNDAERLRATNVRTALVLATIALVFFGGIIVAKFMGGWTVGMSIVGFAVFVFLAFAIGRNLRKPR